MRTLGCAVVEISKGEEAPTRHVLRSGSYVLGSAASSDLNVAASGLSRRHLQIDVLADGGVLLTDLGSSNGTRHGKRRISTMAALEPTRLGVGEATVTVYPDTDHARMIELPELSAINTDRHEHEQSTSTPVVWQPSIATDMPQTGWALILALGDSQERLQAGVPLATVMACVLARWSRLLADAPMKLRSLQAPDAVLAAVGTDLNWTTAPTTRVSHGDLQLEICQTGAGELAGNLVLALRTGLATLAPAAVAAEHAAVSDGGATSIPREVISASPQMIHLYELAAKVAKGHVAVLIQGESGTGKELVAHWIHSQSPRCDGPFLAINCAALPAELLEAEVFGIERGVATGVDARAGLLERARGGTVFLDELGDMARVTQAKILRVLESQVLYRVGGSRPIPLDVRFVAATHRRLDVLAADGGFRLDLYHRLAAVELRLPALRERRADIALLASHFLAEELAALKRPSPGITDAALAALCRHDWPGNVRELRNEMARAALLLDRHQPLSPDLLSDRICIGAASDQDLSLEGALNRAEAEAFAIALAAARNDHNCAMELLKLSRSNYFRRLRAFKAGRRGDQSPVESLD
jgi:DNA-binding NtrC family response regulator/pSer/pThr/pTyr-binding forkhead associated (FHA) protein